MMGPGIPPQKKRARRKTWLLLVIEYVYYNNYNITYITIVLCTSKYIKYNSYVLETLPL